MIEVIKHTFGFCGEPHSTLSQLVFVAIPELSYIHYILKLKVQQIKRFLK